MYTNTFSHSIHFFARSPRTDIMEPFRVWCNVPDSEDQNACNISNIYAWSYVQ